MTDEMPAIEDIEGINADKLIEAAERRRRRRVRRAVWVAAAAVVAGCAAVLVMTFTGGDTVAGGSGDYEPPAQDDVAADDDDETDTDAAGQGTVRIVMDPDAGRLRADLGYSASGDSGEIVLSPSAGGEGVLLPAGECGYLTTCLHGLPAMFDDDLDGLLPVPAGNLPEDTPGWLDARLACYNSPRPTEDCNAELAGGGYGTLTAAGFDQGCLADVYASRLSFTRQGGPPGWWECESPWWNPAALDETDDAPGALRRDVATGASRLCTSVVAFLAAAGPTDSGTELSESADGGFGGDDTDGDPAAFDASPAAPGAAPGSGPADPETADAGDYGCGDALRAAGIDPAEPPSASAHLCTAAVAVSTLTETSLDGTIPPCGVWQRAPLSIASLELTRSVERDQRSEG